MDIDTEVLLREVAERMEAIIVVTAAEGLTNSFSVHGSMTP